MTIINDARKIAQLAHSGQKYGIHPYIVHLDAVVNVLARFGHGENQVLIISAYLHDTLEDTDLTEQEIKKFGEKVFNIVRAVTKIKSYNRKEGLKKTYLNIKRIPEAVTLKLADRIANVEASLKDNQKKLEIYKAEYYDLRETLFDDQNLSMWKNLDDLLSK